MYGDTTVMRRRAAQFREQGADLRASADVLVGQADQVAWRGRAADAMRDRIRERAAHLRSCASRHESAADTLEAHVHHVDDLKDAIAQVERRASRLDQGPLADLDPPPSGHRDWLTIDLPGP